MVNLEGSLLKPLRKWRLELLFNSGQRMETVVTAEPQWSEDAIPAGRYYLGFGDADGDRGLEWITVGGLSWIPQEVAAAQITPIEVQA